MITHKGVYYFPSATVAEMWAQAHGWPIDRIIEFKIGWAVQAGKSGNYAGPGETPRTWQGA